MVSLVSVVLPVYNGEKFLAEAVESILKQTYAEFELLAIDDGSTDRSSEILNGFQYSDSRVQIIKQPRNMGLIAALNTGCQRAKGEFIARMDADDICLPERFERQVAYLKANPQVGVVGSNLLNIDEYGVVGHVSHLPTSSGYLSWRMIFGSYLAHPSVMVRRDLLEALGYYRPEAHRFEDYDLWMRILARTQVANLPEALLKYRTHRQSSMVSARGPVEERSIELVQKNVQSRLNKQVSYEAAAALRAIDNHDGIIPRNASTVYETARSIHELYRHHVQTVILTQPDISNIRRDIAMKKYFLALYSFKFIPLYAVYMVISGFVFAPESLIDAVVKLIKKIAK